MSNFLLGGIAEGRAKLKQSTAPVVERRVDLASFLATEVDTFKENDLRAYFFQASVDEWYNSMPQHTFASRFVTIEEHEARYIVDLWNEERWGQEPVVVPDSLASLGDRIDSVIAETFPGCSGVFVKLSSRSPKDSKAMFKRAVDGYRRLLDTDGNINDDISARSAQHNARLIALSNELCKVQCLVTNGREALELFLDSSRVAEDLKFAIDGGEGEKKDTVFSLSVCVRGWDNRIVPKCEYRAFVWDGKLNALGQYWHSLHWPDLVDLKDDVAADCLSFFEKIRASLPVPNAMLDLAWLGPGEVLLIEVNPLAEGLGSFKGSTGLFDFYDDSDVLTGKAPFEVRVRTTDIEKSDLLKSMSPLWRDVIFPYEK